MRLLRYVAAVLAALALPVPRLRTDGWTFALPPTLTRAASANALTRAAA
ncbi:hypothetical protein [Catenuloplanes indicus]|uniref:Uncharacterized protein n=1 Tax=Catenuloplanes indicus TaxID=137267 RepID=A0AAE3W8G4_9ACTN|nr:hypothetical protein [Catenuloplanes indicus]MDQ0370432.1 hypothetical protein [Catenuloplanes indicus]